MSRGTRRPGALAAGTVAGMLVLAGCSGTPQAPTGPDETGTPSPTDTTGPGDEAPVGGEITVLTWSGADGALKSVLPAFEAAHPEITVDLQVIGYDDVSSRLNVGLQSGTDLPDVVSIVSDRVPTVTATFPDGLADLREFDLQPDRWAAAKWPALTGPDGELFGVPWDLGPVAVYYRIDMLEAVGVDPASIETWEDYLALGAELAEQDISLFPVQVDNSQLFTTMLQQLGESYFTESGEVNIASPAAVEAATLIREAIDDGYALVTNNDEDYVASYKNERVATLVPRQADGRFWGWGKLGMRGSARPRWTSRGRFQAMASWGRTVL